MDSLTNSKKSEGFTLIGVLVAAIIIVMGTLATTRLLGTTERFAGLGRENFIAINSAREGLELVRAMRDTNWFTNEDRTFWLDHGICRTDTTTFSDTKRQFTVDPSVVRNNDTVTLGDIRLYVNATNNEWTHTASDKLTPFSRIITVDCSQAEAEVARVTVESKVTWTSRGQEREVSVKEVFFNWLPEQVKINP